MNSLAAAVLRSGLLDQETVNEFRKWGSPIEFPERLPPFPRNPSEVVILLEEALQSEGFVLTKETDLEILSAYMTTQKQGGLHLSVGDQSTNFEVTYGMTTSGEYILPWRSETIQEEMTNGQTHLCLRDGTEIYFKDVRELFFGEVKAFMVCRPLVLDLKRLEVSNGHPS